MVNNPYEKINFSLADMEELDVICYLSMFNWIDAKSVQFTDVNITDEQFKQVLDFLKHKKV